MSKKLNLLTGLIILCASFSATAQKSAKVKIEKLNLYAGIEVGSKGIKMSILQIPRNDANSGNYTSIKDTSINTDFILFTNRSFSNTVKGLSNLYNVAANEYGVPTNKIYTVVSSGVKGQAEKENKIAMIKQLTDSFRLAINDASKQVPVISVTDEAILSHLGIVPENRRFNTFLIDIGSGNTKGGYFRNGNTKDLKLFTLNWGTKSVANATEYRTSEDNSMANYKKQLARVLAGDPEKEVTLAVNQSGAYNMNDYFAFSGGIAWSVATLMYPELSDNPVVPFNYNDLVKFNERLTNNYESLLAKNISKLILDKNVNKTNAANEAAKVQKVFDQKALMAGTGLLLKIVRQFEGTQEKKQFFLVKNGQVGWISAYVKQDNSK
jgi:hypothetical protein